MLLEAGGAQQTPAGGGGSVGSGSVVAEGSCRGANGLGEWRPVAVLSALFAGGAPPSSGGAHAPS